MPENDKALILVDLQNDFLPGGALAVPNGHEVVPVANLLQLHFDRVVATQESAQMNLRVRYDEDLLTWLRQTVRVAAAPLYTGFPDAERDPAGSLRKFNSSGLFAADGTLIDRYAKHHLLPIGEAMPFTRWLPFLARIDVGQAEWSPGPEPR